MSPRLTTLILLQELFTRIVAESFVMEVHRRIAAHLAWMPRRMLAIPSRSFLAAVRALEPMRPSRISSAFHHLLHGSRRKGWRPPAEPCGQRPSGHDWKDGRTGIWPISGSPSATMGFTTTDPCPASIGLCSAHRPPAQSECGWQWQPYPVFPQGHEPWLRGLASHACTAADCTGFACRTISAFGAGNAPQLPRSAENAVDARNRLARIVLIFHPTGAGKVPSS